MVWRRGATTPALLLATQSLQEDELHIWVRGVNKRTSGYTLLDLKLAVESISEVSGAAKAHLDVVNGPVPLLHLYPEVSYEL